MSPAFSCHSSQVGGALSSSHDILYPCLGLSQSQLSNNCTLENVSTVEQRRNTSSFDPLALHSKPTSLGIYQHSKYLSSRDV